MEPGSPDVINQLPATGNPMRPTSGTYGEVADTERLKQQLDVPGAGPGGAEVRPNPAPPPGAPIGPSSQPSTGVPDVLMGPTSMPDVPQSTPLRGAGPTATPAATVRSHIAALDALVASPTTSNATKEWAKLVLERYKS